LIAVPPNPPFRTSKSVRFIAAHISNVRIIPDAPTKAPATIKIILFTINPADIAAIPESEFKNAMTTGMSAPPITATLMIPAISARSIKYSRDNISISSQIAGNKIRGGKKAEKMLAIVVFTLFNFPRSFRTAMMLPEKVNTPITIENMATKKSDITNELFDNSTYAIAPEAPPPKPLNKPTSSGICVI